MTPLHIGASQTRLGETVLPIGAAQIAASCFHHDPPTGPEIERAIDVVEDALMRLVPQPEAMLVSGDAAIAALAGESARELSRDAVEAMFQRLASAALGDPTAARGLPAGREAAAVLLILREVMHHGGFARVVVEPQAAR